jgi:hypothetical protein
MTQRRKHHDSAPQKDADRQPVALSSPVSPPDAADMKHCAYNRTRERFLSADVDAGDFCSTSLDARLPALAPKSGAGLWLIPFRGISLTSVRVPVDLVYLDPHFTVVATVESFPIGRLSDSSPSAASVLVLPADTICNTETRPGDRLILCTSDEMKMHLRELAASNDGAQPELPAVSEATDPDSNAAGRLLRWKNRSRQKNPMEQVSAPVSAPVSAQIPAVVRAAAPAHEELASEAEPWVQEPQETIEIETAQESVKPAKNWLQRFFADPEPAEPRENLRESMPGLSAYFFTGGAPEEHGVRDISPTGMYVFTEERWYPGTMIRMTLTDRIVPGAERSITLNMTVVRSGNDGVGLSFAFPSSKDRRQRQAGGMAQGADKPQVDQFLQRLKSARGQGAQ